MNKPISSKEAILAVCRQFIAQEGTAALNMRRLAQRCDLALGSLYNYFPSKAALISAAVESVWLDIFHVPEDGAAGERFLELTQRLFNSARESAAAYPRFFAEHSLFFPEGEKDGAKRRMAQCLSSLRASMLECLKNDPLVRRDAFNESFTPEGFVDCVLGMLPGRLSGGASDGAVILEMIRRSLYQERNDL